MKIGILLIITSIVLFAAGYETSSLTRANAAQKETIDSLQGELFNANTTIGRYEITLELLAQRDSIAAAKFDRILNSETE